MTYIRKTVTGVVLVAIGLSVFRSPSLAQDTSLVAPGATVRRLATGFGFLEGPAADPDGNLFFTDIPNERIHRWSPPNGVTIFHEGSGRANGLRFDLDGNLLVCEMGNRRVTSIDPRGVLTILADRFEGHRFNSPNDLWVDLKGGIYFSDPRYGAIDDQEIDGYHVYYIEPDQARILQVTSDLVRPNGLIGTPDGSRVYIADHGGGRTYTYTPNPDGTLSNKRLFVAQGSDGMAMDERGNVYLTGQDVTIYNPDGEPISSIAIPEVPANLTFGGAEGTTLFITARTSLYAVEMTVTGQ